MKIFKKLPMIFAASLMFVLGGCFNPSFPNTCFVEGTMISSPDGNVAVEDVGLGQTVYSYDEESKKVVSGIVEEVIVKDAGSYLSINLSNDSVLKVTPDHSVAVVNGESLQWLDASELDKGMTLVALDDGLRVEPTKITNLRTVYGAEKVYNVKVRRYKNSFAEGILTHFYFP